MPQYGGDIGQVINVRGSPGPATGIDVDVLIQSPAGPIMYRGVRPYGLPADFDIRIIPGTKAIVVWISDTEGVWCCEWVPETEECL